MKFLEILDYLKNQDMTMTRYERDEWDAFVAKTKLRIAFPFIHITGSNGKGSTAHYLYEIYRAEGYKVALFSKPYFRQVNEMMEVNGKLITDEDFARIFTLREKEIKAGNLSSFEIETYIALAYFNEQKPDLAIIECGMGGATDSTNLHHHDRLARAYLFLRPHRKRDRPQQSRHHQSQSPDSRGKTRGFGLGCHQRHRQKTGEPFLPGRRFP
jgi:folylpolyglutamate synthase/dihydropteroate synthase